jgi:hypothetical protein
METMNLNDANDGMVSLPPKVPEKNIPKQQQTKMDSTPIADLMSGPDMMPMDATQDPRAAYNMMPQSPMMAVAAAPAQKSQDKPKKSEYPFNLTHEQFMSVLAGVAAMIAFSKPIQDKLATSVPKFLSETGSRSTTGLIASGLVAALIFYLAHRFSNK